MAALLGQQQRLVVPPACPSLPVLCPGGHTQPHTRAARLVAARASAQVAERAAAAAEEQGAIPPFHLAFPVADLASSREFYGGVLGCTEGRRADSWQDYSLFGHQIVLHRVAGYNAAASHNAVDGDAVPVPHFGLALTVSQFETFSAQLKERGVEFVIQPHLRFKGQPGEQFTMFFKDPSGNALEFKAMTNPGNLFAKYHVDC